MPNIASVLKAIHAEPSACTSVAPGGRCERSIGLTLSSPRKPPPKRLLPSGS